MVQCKNKSSLGEIPIQTKAIDWKHQKTANGLLGIGRIKALPNLKWAMSFSTLYSPKTELGG